MLSLVTWGWKTEPSSCQVLPWTGEGVGHQAMRQDLFSKSVPSPHFPWIAQNKFQRSFSLKGVQEKLCCLPLRVLSASTLQKSCACPSAVV